MQIYMENLQNNFIWEAKFLSRPDFSEKKKKKQHLTLNKWDAARTNWVSSARITQQ